MSREEQFLAEKTMKLAKGMIEISSILSKPELTKEDNERLQNRLSYLHNIEMGKDVGLSQEIATIARAVAFKAKTEAEKSLPEAMILPFGSGGAHATFPKSLIGKTIKYYVQGSEQSKSG